MIYATRNNQIKLRWRLCSLLNNILLSPIILDVELRKYFIICHILILFATVRHKRNGYTVYSKCSEFFLSIKNVSRYFRQFP